MIKTLLNNAYVEWITRLLLGIFFIYASWHKIMDPQQFAFIMEGYDLFPEASIPPLAYFVPWLEFFLGAYLILGVFPKETATVVILLLTSFCIALGYNWLRGHEFDCGCTAFGSAWGSQPPVLIGRNLLLISVAFYLACFKNDRKILIPIRRKK